jgi:hypothetical protein
MRNSLANSSKAVLAYISFASRASFRQVSALCRHSFAVGMAELRDDNVITRPAVPLPCRKSSMTQSIGVNRAEEARSVAEQLADPESRRMMLRIAEDYERLAQHAEQRAAKRSQSDPS